MSDTEKLLAACRAKLAEQKARCGGDPCEGGDGCMQPYRKCFYDGLACDPQDWPPCAAHARTALPLDIAALESVLDLAGKWMDCGRGESGIRQAETQHVRARGVTLLNTVAAALGVESC